MQTSAKYSFLLCLLLSFIFACKSDDEQAITYEKKILTFSFPGFDPLVEGVVNQDNKTITVEFPFQSDLENLSPSITVSEGALVDPASGEPNDFSDPVLYTVTSKDGTQSVYTVISSLGASNENDLLNFSFPAIFIDADIEGNNVTASVPFGTDLSALSPSFTRSDGSTVDPASGVAQDFSSPVMYTVTAANGEEQEYTVQITENEQDVAIRGVWITDVSSVLTSRANIIAAVEKVEELNLNTIFMVTWNQAMTTYPSQVMEDLTGTRIDPRYGARDPLQEMIEEAHARGIKVMAWFEYGFAANYASPDKSLPLSEQIQLHGGPVLQARPEWAGVDVNGDLLEKNNFIWMNGLNPEVQQFMNSLILEVVNNYDIDGIQGDDRLPAMPSEGGYDAYTLARYEEEFNAAPPELTKSQAWLRWRADILNKYAEELYQEVKLADPNCVVAMSPSPLDFGYVEYLQDYPAWVNNGYSDIVSPQLYRRSSQGIGVYNSLLTYQLSLIDSDKISTFYPGLLIALGAYAPTEEFFAEMVQSNRAKGVMGEVFFYYLGLSKNEKVIKALYPGKAIYPDF